MQKKLFYDFIETQIDDVYRFAYTYVGDQHTAEDVVAESVEKALRKISTLRDPSLMKTWFYRVVINTAKNSLQKQSRIIPTADEQLDTIILDDHSLLHFEDMIKLVPPQDRVILTLRFCEDRKLSEIADIMEINESTVKTKLYLALKKLRIEIELEELNV
jgi:RNA polymerase sigma-70 factor (ECF subfamily)